MAFTALMLAATLAPQVTLPNPFLVDKLRPNYAMFLESPIEGSDIRPTLEHPWRHFPIHVTVLDDVPEYSEAAFQCIRRAANRWAGATALVPGGGVSFMVEHGPMPGNPQVVVRFRWRNDLNGFYGITLPRFPHWKATDLAVTDLQENALPAWRIERVATHELGHALGISGHSPDDDDTMSLAAQEREVSAADANTLQIAYGGRFN